MTYHFSLELFARKGCKLRDVSLREVTGCFFVFGLFFSQEACEGDDVGVDLLLLERDAISIGGHVED